MFLSIIWLLGLMSIHCWKFYDNHVQNMRIIVGMLASCTLWFNCTYHAAEHPILSMISIVQKKLRVGLISLITWRLKRTSLMFVLSALYTSTHSSSINLSWPSTLWLMNLATSLYGNGSKTARPAFLDCKFKHKLCVFQIEKFKCRTNMHGKLDQRVLI